VLTRNDPVNFLAFSLLFLMAMPCVSEAQQTTERKVEPFRAGLKGVTSPQCLRCPAPKFSKAARKAKVAGTVLLDVTVTTDGEVKNPTVIKSPGYGLEEKAIEKVVTWKMKPALGPDGQPVNCRVQIEVTFHFYPNG
jgi:TonB family protein